VFDLSIEMIEQFEEKIHVQKDVHQIFHLRHYLLYHRNTSVYMDMNKYDNYLFYLQSNFSKFDIRCKSGQINSSSTSVELLQCSDKHFTAGSFF
jgi:hypothetical protein